MTDYVFPDTGVDAGMIVIADPDFYKDWGFKSGYGHLIHSVDVDNGDYIAEWTVPNGWLEENKKPTTQPLKITSGKLWVGDPCYIVANDKWIEFLEKYKYFDEDFIDELLPKSEGVIAVNTGGDGGFTVRLKLTKQ